MGCAGISIALDCGHKANETKKNNLRKRMDDKAQATADLEQKTAVFQFERHSKDPDSKRWVLWRDYVFTKVATNG